MHEANPARGDGVHTAVRHEEVLRARAVPAADGALRLQVNVDELPVQLPVERTSEQAGIAREPAHEGDSGQVETLADGTISIPLFEEELVVTKRLRVRERVLVRKHVQTTSEQVSAQIRRERIDVQRED